MDALSQLLSSFDLYAQIFVNTQFCGHWHLLHKDSGNTTFHLISRGECWLHFDNGECQHLKQGDIVLLPKDCRHWLSSYPNPPEIHTPPERISFQEKLIPESTGVLCGNLFFRRAKSHPLFDELPQVLVFSDQQDIQQWATPLCLLLQQEQLNQSEGSQLIINKLAEVLFIQCLRHHLNQQQHHSGWLCALQNPGLYRALHAIHQRPEYKWTLATLAQEAGMSRTVFAERFRQTLNQSPFQYLEWWRMQKAWEHLSQIQETVYATALKVGYGSESAFSKAFKRHFGKGPGEVRKSHNES